MTPAIDAFIVVTDSCHVDGFIGGTRERTRFNCQFIRHACDTQRIFNRQTDSVYRVGDVELLYDVFIIVTLFDVPVKGSFFTLTVAAFLFVIFCHRDGFIGIHSDQSQIASMFW